MPFITLFSLKRQNDGALKKETITTITTKRKDGQRVTIRAPCAELPSNIK